MTTLAAAGVALAAIGTAASTVALIQSSRTQAAVAEAQAKAGEVQATNIEDISELESEARIREAAGIKESAEFEERKSRRRSQQLIAKQRAIGAASGIDISSGSPLFMELDSTRQAEIEALNIRRSGEISSTGKEFEANLGRFSSASAASSTRFQSGINIFNAQAIRRQIPWIAIGGAAKIGGSVLGSWNKTENK